MELQDLFKEAGVTEKELTQRLAEVALLPDEPDCPIWMEWDIPSARELRAIFKSCRKKRSDDLDDDKAAKRLVERSFKGVHGLSVNSICDYGLLAPSHDTRLKLAAAVAQKPLEEFVDLPEREQEELGDIELDAGMQSAVFLLDKSSVFRGRCAEFITVAAILDAEESLRKKRSAATSDTAN